MSAANSVSSRPRNHVSHLEQLHKLDLTSANPAFDRLARLAARVLKAPLVLVSLIDQDRQWFISAYGLPDDLRQQGSIPLSDSLCYHIQADGQAVKLNDVRTSRYRDKAKMIIALGGIAYAGVPLIDIDRSVCHRLPTTRLDRRRD